LVPMCSYCRPATSAAGERAFSGSGLFVRPHRARISDTICCVRRLWPSVVDIECDTV